MKYCVYRVSNPEHRTQEIAASSRLKALYIAAKRWRVPFGARLLEESTVEWVGPAGGGKKGEQE